MLKEAIREMDTMIEGATPVLPALSPASGCF
jgi:hypothetical protein